MTTTPVFMMAVVRDEEGNFSLTYKPTEKGFDVEIRWSADNCGALQRHLGHQGIEAEVKRVDDATYLVTFSTAETLTESIARVTNAIEELAGNEIMLGDPEFWFEPPNQSDPRKTVITYRVWPGEETLLWVDVYTLPGDIRDNQPRFLVLTTDELGGYIRNVNGESAAAAGLREAGLQITHVDEESGFDATLPKTSDVFAAAVNLAACRPSGS